MLYQDLVLVAPTLTTKQDRTKGSWSDCTQWHACYYCSSISLCMCVHEGLCFQYTALGNHRSVPQQTTSYATGQSACLHKWCSYYDWWMVWMFSTGVYIWTYAWCSGAVPSLGMWTYLSTNVILTAIHVQVLPVYCHTCTVVFKVVSGVYAYIPMHH